MKEEPSFDEIREQIEKEKVTIKNQKKTFLKILGIVILVAILFLLKGK